MDASARAFDKVYERLGVRLTLRGESFYNPLLEPLVKEVMESGIGEESDGAKVSSRPAVAMACAGGVRVSASGRIVGAV